MICKGNINYLKIQRNQQMFRNIFNIRQSIEDLNGIADIMIIVMNGNVR